jgi:hypothetical protein
MQMIFVRPGTRQCRGFFVAEHHSWRLPSRSARKFSKVSRRQTVARLESRMPLGKRPSETHFQKVQTPMPRNAAQSFGLIIPECWIVEDIKRPPCFQEGLWVFFFGELGRKYADNM